MIRRNRGLAMERVPVVVGDSPERIRTSSEHPKARRGPKMTQSESGRRGGDGYEPMELGQKIRASVGGNHLLIILVNGGTILVKR